MNRIMMLSTQPPAKPATAPKVAPMSSTRMEHMMPTVRLMRVAIISRTAKSRPSLSVPQMWGNTFSPASMRWSSVLPYSKAERFSLYLICWS